MGGDDRRGVRPAARFSEAILSAKANGFVPVICDIKPVSPRDGDLLKGRKPGELARALEGAGACALSVVTEPRHFGGSLETLRAVTRAASLPVLRKDFFSDPAQLRETADAGAAAVLLILANTPDPLAASLFREAVSLGLEVVVEVHTPDQIGRALRLQPRIIGINNRDILRLETDPGDVSVTEVLAPLVPEGILTISESSLRSAEDVRRAIRAGAHAVLVGTALLQSDRVADRLAELGRRAMASA